MDFRCQPLQRCSLAQRAGWAEDATFSLAAVIEALTRQADLVDSGKLDRSTPTYELPIGVLAPYLLDLLAHDPVPMLLLQGERDYQVTAEGDSCRPQHVSETVIDDVAAWMTVG